MEHLIHSAHRAHEAFSNTAAGLKLLELPRYGRFVPPIDGFTVAHWENLVGPDGNNLRHMRRSISDARDFVTSENKLHPQSFTPRELIVLTRAAATHDQAEAIHGDTAYGKKVSSAREAEAMTLLEHVEAFSPGMSEQTVAISREAAAVAFGNTEEKLPGAFKTVELIGFMKNTLDCLQTLRRVRSPLIDKKRMVAYGIKTDEDRAKIVIALERLTTEVLGSGVLSKLIQFGERFPSAHKYLIDHASEITAGFEGVREETFEWYSSGEDPAAGPDEQEHRLERFASERANWNQWVNHEAHRRERSIGAAAMIR